MKRCQGRSILLPNDAVTAPPLAAGVPPARPGAGLPLEAGLQHGETRHQPEDAVQEPGGCGQSRAARGQRHGRPGVGPTEIGRTNR